MTNALTTPYNRRYAAINEDPCGSPWIRFYAACSAMERPVEARPSVKVSFLCDSGLLARLDAPAGPSTEDAKVALEERP